MSRRIAGALMIVAMLLGTSGLAEAEDQSPVISRIIDKGVLRVGTSGSQPPFSMTDTNGRLFGYEVDLAELLAKALDVELLLVRKPFPELLPALEAGEVDLVMSGMTMTPERNARVAFVGPYIVSGKSILATSASLAAAIAIANEVEQKELTVSALKNSTSEWFAKKTFPESKLVTTDDYDTAVEMVLDGKADAMIADIPICALSILRYPDSDLVTLPKPLTIEPIGVALPVGDWLLLNMVENYLDALERIGYLQILEKRWFEDDTWLVKLPKP
jgi:polar amino acid transport system substrate-binding protein